MENLLYIFPEILSKSGGADIINNRNLDLLRSIKAIHLYTYELKHINRINTFFELFKGNTGFLRASDFDKITTIIKQYNIKLIFLWSSRIGQAALFLKYRFPDIKIITFFHNIEIHYYKEELRLNNSLKNRLIARITNANELKACRYSDFLITLNDRDSHLLSKYYKKTATITLPTSFADIYNREESKMIRKQYPKDPFRLLFVGTSFFANIEGVRWFINKVMPSLHNCQLTVAGKGMDKIFYSTERIQVKGYVDSLKEIYYGSDLVISPIFSGGGMKTKTCEAMMFGVPIVGTPEAFEGYDVDYNKVGGIFNNEQEMIERINHLNKYRDDLNKSSEYARQIFLEKYETTKLKSSLIKLINSII